MNLTEKNNLCKLPNDTCLYLLTSLPVPAFCILLHFLSPIGDSTKISFGLTILTFWITLSFEILEWKNYIDKRKKREKKKANYISPLLYAIIFTFFTILAYNLLFKYIEISEEDASMILNSFTSIILSLYCISYTYRSIKITNQNN